MAGLVSAAARVVVAGGGFGGLYAAAYLGRSELADRGGDVLLVSERNYFTFTPLLAEVAAGALGREHVTVAYRALARRYGFRFLQARVEGRDETNRTLLTTRGPLPYDHVVLALGAQPRYFSDAVRSAALPFTSVEDALRIRDAVIQRAERAVTVADPTARARLLTFVVAGAGPAGVEVASEIWHLLRDVLPRYYAGLEPARVVLVEGGDRILVGFDPGLAGRALELLRARGIDVRVGTRVSDVADGTVSLDGSDGRERLAADVLIWTAGTTPARTLEALNLPTVRGGYVAVDAELRVAGCADTYAIGDIAGLEDPHTGRPYPKVAPIAISQGIRAAANVENVALGRAPEPYSAYHAGKIVSLGDGQALVDILGWRVTGRVAWWLYRAAYVLKLVGAKNKFRVVTTLALNRYFGRDLTCEC